MPDGQFRQGVATAIRALRAERGWTQRELCRRTELSPAYLSELEAAQKDASAEVLGRLANAFNVGMDQFLWNVLLAILTGEVPGVQRREAALRVARSMLETGPEKRRDIEQFIEFQQWRGANRPAETRTTVASEIIDETEENKPGIKEGE